MKRARTLTTLSFLAVAVVAAGAAGATRSARTATADTASPGAAPAAARTEAAATAVQRARRAPGDFRRYAIDSRLQMKTGAGPLPESAPPTVRLKGSWQETVAGAGAEGTLLVVAFTPSEVAPETLSRRDLGRPFAVVVGADGQVSSVSFERGVSGDARQALRAVVAEMQLTRAPAPSLHAWRVEEDDTTGRYRAAYRQISATAIERTKEGYDQVVTSKGLTPPARGEDYAVESLTRYQLDDDGALVRLGLREALRIVTGQGTPEIKAVERLDVSLVEAGHGDVPEAVEGVAEALASLTARGNSEEHDIQMARGADYGAVRARLADLERLDPKAYRRAVTHVMPQARAVLRLDRVAALDAARAVADRTTPPGTASVLATALATAGTAEARAALLDLARSDDTATRLTAARALAQLENPDDDSAGTLTSMLADGDKEVAGAAGLALGSNVRQSGGVSASDANAAAVQALIARYDAATDDATRVTCVYALGNAGGREVLPVMLDALGRGVTVAASAAYGLRFVPGADVDQILSQLLARGAVSIRISAVQAVLDRDRATWAPRLSAMLEGQLPDTLRQAISAALGNAGGN